MAGLWNIFRPTLKATPDIQRPTGDISSLNDMPPKDLSLYKAYSPQALYNMPYGIPRKDNVILERNLAKNPYIYNIIKSLQDEVACTKFDIAYKEEAVKTPELDNLRLEILKFFDNPNNNKESFQDLLKKIVRDLCEVDSAVLVKVFTRKKQMSQIMSYGGETFLMNPDIHGYLGGRADYVEPMLDSYTLASDNYSAPINMPIIQRYDAYYRVRAAYFQFGFTANAFPVPFGKREVIYMMMNPKANEIYGQSPVGILADILISLIYGAQYNLDFYMNNNMPEGIIEILNANDSQIQRFREHLTNRVTTTDPLTNLARKIGFKIPVVNQPAKFTPFNLDPKTMQIIEQQDWFYKLTLSAFGLNPDDMGITENSNRAVSFTQDRKIKRKAVRPLLNMLAYKFNMELIAEWGEEAFKNLEFKWEDYDLEEDLKKHQLLQMEIAMGIKTPEMVAKELGIDYNEVMLSQTKQIETQQANLNKYGYADTQMNFPGNMNMPTDTTGNSKNSFYKTTGDSKNETKPKQGKYTGNPADTQTEIPKDDRGSVSETKQTDETESQASKPKTKGKKEPEINSELEKTLVDGLKVKEEQLLEAIENLNKGSLSNIR